MSSFLGAFRNRLEHGQNHGQLFSLSAWKMILLWKMAWLMGSSLNF